MGKVVAVAGVTGAVGTEMLKCLEKLNFPVDTLVPLASARSAGKTITFRGEAIKIQEMTNDSFKGVDIALFSAGGSISKQFRQAVVDAGCVMIDNSSAFRMEDGVPLVVPEVNPEAALKHNGVIANPNCTTIIMLVPLWPLHQKNPVKRVNVATYQSASGAGHFAMEELKDTTIDFLAGKPVTPKALPQQLAMNLFCHNSPTLPNGYNEEEMKMVHETRKIMNYPQIMVSPTSVRVPVLRAHSEALVIEFTNPITPEEVRDILTKAPGCQIIDDREKNLHPTPLRATEEFDVFCGHIRQDVGRDDGRGIAMFICGDQLLKGAALNAVQIAQLLV